MSELGERMARIETLVEGLVEHNRIRDRWMMGILSGLVVSVVLIGVSGCAGWLGGGG